ncbi:MAG: hypothetical protein QXO32_09140 [Candidatus Bathyarchaeia archaeon]
MNAQVIAVLIWLTIGVILLAYILKHNIGRVLKGLLIAYGVIGVFTASFLIVANHPMVNKIYHAWVTVLLFILIMLILAVGGR